MNKKFISICLSIFTISLIFIIGFKFILGDKILYNDSMNYDEGKPIIKYTGFEEDENIYKIKVSIKNNSKYYASFIDINLQFSSESGYIGNANPIFKGYDNKIRESLKTYDEGREVVGSFLDPEEEREYIFEISKGLSFNKETFDTSSISISYDVRYFKYRLNETTVFSSAITRTGTEFIENALEPFTID
ncbi:hypothetical protein [Clostridium sp.]|uniref:Uncharacterized protein n=1 Tax=Clostridium tertium TaxID=1559 RepID=A0A6N3EBJ3_9CLOT|nr:hypothetical protein [Clostridium sp.]MBS5938760.1 hypothetical protein [Clostridium sp.]